MNANTRIINAALVAITILCSLIALGLLPFVIAWGVDVFRALMNV